MNWCGLKRGVSRLAVLVILAGTGDLAFAQEGDSRALELYRNGVQLYEEGRYELAIVAWKEAYAISLKTEQPKSLLLYNIAVA